MEILRVSTKGQVVIPKAIRDRNHWRAGTELVIEDRGDALVLRAAKPFPPTSVEDGLGCTGYCGPTKTLEQIDAGIDAEFRRRWKEGES